MTAAALAKRLGGRKASGGWTARCPAHEDRTASLSIGEADDGKVLIHCHAGCAWAAIIAAAGIEAADLFEDPNGGRGRTHPSSNHATAQPNRGPIDAPPGGELPDPSRSIGLTLEQYAAAKGLPLDFLKRCGLTEFRYEGQPAVRVPYRSEGGDEIAVRFRVALEGDRFRWKSGAKPCLYGLDRLADARAAGHVVLVEGESDAQTLLHHGIPTLGIPGAAHWREDRDAPHLAGIGEIYVVVEPDQGGDAVMQWLGRSSIRHRTKLVTLPLKDPSALYIEAPEKFPARWKEACAAAVPWAEVEAKANADERTAAWKVCSELAGKPDILGEFAAALSHQGVAGEVGTAKLLYLILISRLLDRPVSVAVKGPSSGGKSFIVESTLRFFPASAYYALSAMSDRAIAYSDERLQHRHLVIYEAAGMASEIATYLIRTLLSEGHVRYETVEKTPDGFVSRLIEREGPTGLIVTTTSLNLHPENETRMLSVTITDTPDQTAAVLRALAQEPNRTEIDFATWHALQEWIATGPNRVRIPYANRLAQLIPPIAVRLRRDFKTILILICAHALLHQSSRLKDDDGRVIAEVEDYAAVRELVVKVVSEGVDATVKPEVREVVVATARLLAGGRDEVRQVDLAAALKLDKSAISRRIKSALDLGFLKNEENRRGRPARLVLGEELPEDREILPRPERLLGEEWLRGCAADGGGTQSTPTSASQSRLDDEAQEIEPAAKVQWVGCV